MKFSRYETAADFLESVGEWLITRETINNLILGISERLVADPNAYQNPFFASVKDEAGRVVLAAIMTPPHNLILAGDETLGQGYATLISDLQDNQIDVPGVIGPADIAQGFIEVWRRMTHQTYKLEMRQRVYELRTVNMPPMPPGQFRLAHSQDIPQIAAWIQAFEAEALGEIHELDLARAERLVDRGYMFVWKRAEEIVSMAMKTRPISHSISVGEVYTPPEHRCKGYATALVAQLTQHLLDMGYQFVNLFTDQANPTSNSIYQKLGYFPVCDFWQYTIVK